MDSETKKSNSEDSKKSKNKNHVSNLLETKGPTRTLLKLMTPLMCVFLVDALSFFYGTHLMLEWNPGNAEQIAAIKGLIFSYYKLFMAFTLVAVVGTSMYFSFMLGKKADKETLAKVHGNGFTVALVVSITFFTIMGLTAKPYLNSITSMSNESGFWTEELINDASVYTCLAGFGVMFLLLRNVFGRILRIEGYTNLTSLLQLTMYPIYFILTWVFQAHLQMGMTGAGIAYIIATSINYLTFHVAVLVLRKQGKTEVSFKLKYFIPNKTFVFGILAFGIPASFWNIGFSINETLQSVAFTAIDGTTGTNDCAKMFTAYQLCTQIIQAISVSITTVIAMFVGYLVGSNKRQETKQFMGICSKYMLIINFLCAGILIACYYPILSMVQVSEITFQIVMMWIIMLLSLTFFNAQGYMSSFVVSSKNPKVAVWDIFIKFFLIGIPLQLIFFFGVFISWPVPIYYIAYLPVWAFGSVIYLRYQYLKILKRHTEDLEIKNKWLD